MKKAIIIFWIFTLFLLVLPFVISAPSEDRTLYYRNGTNYFADNIESAGSEKTLEGNSVTNGMQTDNGGWAFPAGDRGCFYSNTGSVTPSKGNFLINCSDIAGARGTLQFEPTNSSFRGKLGFKIYPIDTNLIYAQVTTFTGAGPPQVEMGIFSGISSTKWTCGEPAGVRAVCDAQIDITLNAWTEFIFNWTATDVTLHMANGTLLHTYNGLTGLKAGLSRFGMDGASTILYIDEIWMSSGDRPEAAGPDTTSPNITYYNLTNGNGCENWNTDKNTACSTSSVVPTVQFNTSENAWCAIAGSSSSTSFNLNYTDMGSSRNCTGAAAGEGTTSHLCTLTNQDELVYDTSYFFISCKDSSNNQNSTSTSGALSLSITGLEAAGRTSIGLGIQNALLSGYTNYTDLPVYARNLNNNLAVGIFDKAAEKNNKLWTFNRIGVSDSYVNMPNITNVLYTLEFANKTSSNITLEVEKLVNATK